MNITIPDSFLAAAGITSEAQLRLELAVGLYDSDKLNAADASVMAGIPRDELDAELKRRGISMFRYTEDMWAQDLATLENWRREDERRVREGRAA